MSEMQVNETEEVTLLKEAEIYQVEEYLMEAIPTEAVFEKIEWVQHKVAGPNQPRLQVKITARNPETDKSETAIFNGLDIFRQIQKEKRYNARKQRAASQPESKLIIP